MLIRICVIHCNKSFYKLLPNQVGKHGQLQEWLEDVDDPNDKHRHVSHLWAVYPGKEINWDETPDMVKAARQSLIERGDAATGWSLGWKMNYGLVLKMVNTRINSCKCC
jgi:alpha-L-fucosidase 2